MNRGALVRDLCGVNIEKDIHISNFMLVSDFKLDFRSFQFQSTFIQTFVLFNSSVKFLFCTMQWNLL